MTCRPDWRLLFAAAAALTLGPPLAAAPIGDPLAAAAEALDRGDGIAAEVAADRASEAGLSREQVAAFAGEAELLQGDLVAARNWLGEGRFSPSSAQRGFRALARLEALDGDVAAAARAFDRALAQGSPSARLWVDIGRFRYANGEQFLAVGASERALALDPADPRALEFRGQLLRDAEGARASLPWFERALDKAPDDLGLLGEYAATLGEAGENRRMLEVARRMVELDPRHPRAYFLQAVLAARAGQDDLARRLLWRTDGAYDDVPAGQLLAGILELRTGTPALAVEQFDALARSQPDNARVQLLLGRALLASGEAGEVVARFRTAAARPDASPYLLTLVGRAHEQLGARGEAARYLDRAAAVGSTGLGVLAVANNATVPDDARADVAPLRAMLAQGRTGEASAMATRLGERYRGSADVARVRGDVALLAGDPRTALGHYDRAATIRRDFSLVERSAAAELLLGRSDAALVRVADFVERNPADAPALALLGRMHAARGEWDRALVLLTHARQLDGGADDPRMLVDIALAELQLDDPEAARSTARRAYALQRANGRVAETLARTLQAGEPSAREAEVLLAKARQLSPLLASR